jgi:NAD(P) transhydrogenase
VKLFASIFAIRPGSATVLQQREIYSQSGKPSAAARSLIRPQTLSLQPHVSRVTAIARYASHVAAEPRDDDAELPTSPPFSAGKYETLTVGIPKESYPGERRVAITPQNVALLLKKGFSKVLVEKGAGVEAQFTDEAYELAGAKTVDKRSVFSEADILLKVRPLSTDGADSEVDAIREGATVISFLYPVQNKAVVDRIASRKATAFAMDMIPRISRAQVFDALRYEITEATSFGSTSNRTQFHGKYRWLQGCFRSLEYVWPFPDWSGYCCWQSKFQVSRYFNMS